MENARQQFVERLKAANNILVTVSTDPSVDQLSAAIGLTLMINKLGKHGTAVFSGKVPSTIEFLQPEKTIEKNTDSLRDFIIALDKSKADKLRYKVEENQVKIFITPYRTSITEEDLDFSQGDFNVEVVVAMGVTDQKDLDRAITSHGRILHDATTFALTTGQPSDLGSVNWEDAQASSLCEMIAGLANDLQSDLLDEQMATALLTGIVAETDRFSNQKTSSVTMSTSAALMNAGANQQLVASKLENELKVQDTKPDHKHKEKSDDDDHPGGALQIDHEEKPVHKEEKTPKSEPESDADQLFVLPDVEEVTNELPTPDVEAAEPEQPQPQSVVESKGMPMFEPPTFSSKLTANTEPEALDPSTDPLRAPSEEPTLTSRDAVVAPEPVQPQQESSKADIPEPAPAEEPLEPPVQTLSDLEESVGAQHGSQPEPETPPEEPEPTTPLPADPAAGLGDARSAVDDALASINNDAPLPPIDALNAQPLDLEIKQTGATGIIETPEELAAVTGADFTMPENLVPPSTDLPADTTAAPSADPSAPPTVPPPFMPNMPGLDGDDEPEEKPQLPTNNPFGLPPA